MEVPAPDSSSTSSMKRLLIISNVLPVHLHKHPITGKWSSSFDTDALLENGPLLTGLRALSVQKIFVGVAPVNVPHKERDEVERVLQKMNCYPVFVGAKEASYHFQGVCKSVMWPLFHNVIDLYTEVQIDGLLKSNEAGGSRPPTPTVADSGEWLASRSFNPQEIEMLWPSHMDFIMKFRSAIVSLYNGEGDVVWIHDYHLIMLVGPLRRLLPPTASIGIFLHVPFPSSETFRCLSKRNEILESILQANHVGFHSFEYARHFLTCAQRMLGCTYGAQPGGVFGIKTGKGRTVTLTTAHCGLDFAVVQATLKNLTRPDRLIAAMGGQPSANGNESSNKPLFKAIKPFGGTKVIVAVDEVEGLRGLSLKLLAIDRMLANNPKMRGKIVLKQVGLNLDSRPHDFARCMEEVERLLTQMNEKWGENTIQFVVMPSCSLEQRLELYASADILLQTCVKWGLTVDAMEFVAANRARAEQATNWDPKSFPSESIPRGPGVVIISEFVSASRVLPGVIRTNPWSVEETAKAIEQAATMPLEERIARCSRDYSFIETRTVQTWAEVVLHDVVASSPSTKDAGSQVLMSYGLGVGMRAVGAGEGKLRELDMNEFCEEYAKSKQIRALVFDYSGTLVETTPVDLYLKSGGQARSWHYAKEQGAELHRRQGGCLETRDPVKKGVLQSLKRLSENPRNRVVVITMDLRDELAHALKDVPNVILVAENGYATMLNGTWRQLVEEDDSGGDWYGGDATSKDQMEGLDAWQREVKSVMAIYVERTAGAFEFTAPSSVTFNYMLADPELGDHQAKSLAMQLEKRIAGLPLVLERGKGQLTVRNRAVNRGAVLTQLLKLLPEACDFVACFGDDIEDELMFRAALDAKIPTTYACRVGEHGVSDETRAKYFLHDAGDVGELLEKLAETGDDALGGLRSSTAATTDLQQQPKVSMLPGGFVTKKSMLSLSSIDLANASKHGSSLDMGNTGKSLQKKSSMNLPHVPSMGVLDDMLPAPMAIPKAVAKMDTNSPSLVGMYPAQSSMPFIASLPVAAVDGEIKPKSAAVVKDEQTPSRPSFAAGLGGGGPKTREIHRPEPENEMKETAKLTGAVVVGALVASLVFFIIDRRRRGV